MIRILRACLIIVLTSHRVLSHLLKHENVMISSVNLRKQGFLKTRHDVANDNQVVEKNTSHTGLIHFLNSPTLVIKDDPTIDIVFSQPDYSDPDPLFMPNNNGPMFRSGWKLAEPAAPGEPVDCPNRARVQKAFFDVMRLSEAASAYMFEYNAGRNDGSSYLRYFPKQTLNLVTSIVYNTYFNVANPRGRDPEKTLWYVFLTCNQWLQFCSFSHNVSVTER